MCVLTIDDVANWIYEVYRPEYQASDRMKDILALQIMEGLQYHEQEDEFLTMLDHVGVKSASKSLIQDENWLLDVRFDNHEINICY